MASLPFRARDTMRAAISAVLFLAAGYSAWWLWQHFQIAPWTRDGRVRAEIVSVAPDIAGLVTEVDVSHDQTVHRGQTLFVIDPSRYALALRQAEAALAAQRGAIPVQQAACDVQRAALAAREANLAEALKEAARNARLGHLVAQEQAEQTQTKVAGLRADIAQGKAAVAQAEAALQEARLALGQAEAARDLAALNLARTRVTAPLDGVMSDVNLRAGDYVAPGKPALALIDTASLRVEGYFEETKLGHMHVGQRADIRLMGESTMLTGRITSIAAAIEDRERAASANLLPNVNPTFSWVRLAQRVPVRITLDAPPPDLRLIAGRTASVVVLPDRGVAP